MNLLKFINRSNIIHNNKYDYSLINVDKINVDIICREHGVFNQNKYKHLYGSICPKCNKDRKKLTINQFIERSNIIHNNKYDYSLVKFEKTNNSIKIICKDHGEFNQIVNNHLNKKYGCKKCADYNKSLSVNEFIKKANEIHNNKYEYKIDDIKNNRQKIKIKCEEHGEFSQSILNHLSGNGCNICNNLRKSKGEKFIIDFLENNNIKYIPQKTFDGCFYYRKLKYDFYILEYNICLEYDGQHHFKPVNWFGGEEYFKTVIKKDLIKNKFCLDSNIKLLRIKYTEFNNIEDILKKELNI